MTEDRRQETGVRSQKNRSQRTGHKEQARIDKRILQLIVFFVLTSVLCFLMPVFFHSAEASAADKKRFVYNIYWAGIKGGTAVFEYETAPEDIIVRTHATSAEFISLFYKVDDFAQSTLYPDGYPKSFILKVREGRHKRNKVTYFDKKAEGGPQKVLYQDILDDEKKEFYLDKQAYDPLSAFWAMTKMPLVIGSSKYFDIFDTKKLYHTEVQVLRKEKVLVQSREFNTILIKPIMQSEGIFRRTGDIFIWVTDDDRKIPVLMKSKALIGTFTVELTEGDF
jgi:hypothetical protein